MRNPEGTESVYYPESDPFWESTNNGRFLSLQYNELKYEDEIQEWIEQSGNLKSVPAC